MSSPVALWVWLCACLNCAGWLLSAGHALNRAGYAAVLAAGLVALWVWSAKTATPVLPKFQWGKFRRRFRRSFPLAFLILAVLAFLGGALYGPSNYDALAYRLPRVLHWLAAERWHWIHSIFDRLNNRSCGIEWVSAPLIALTHTDRLLFLINFVSFALLPGLVFSLFTRLGVRPRVAWHWMWLVPSGYCFLLQAGSIGNDLFGAVFALAAVDFSLRAMKSSRPADFFAALLAAAMMTSAKTSNLPLLLPCAAALLFALKLVFRQPLKTAFVLLLALSASALPTMYFNYQNTNGDWSGAGLNQSRAEQEIPLRTTAGLVLVMVQNWVPPVFPLAKAWHHAVQATLSPKLKARLHATMAETGAAEFEVTDMQIEECAGLGFGLSLLLPASFLAAGWLGRRKTARGFFLYRVTLVRWLPAMAFLAVLSQCGMSSLARIVTPFYALLMPLLLTGAGHDNLLRKTWWRLSAFAVFAIAGLLLVITPARPLFPVLTLIQKIPHLPVRVSTVYSVYRARNDAFAPARAELPPGVKILGLISYDDPTASLWQPFGSRRIEEICPPDSPAELKRRGLEYVLVNADKFPPFFGMSSEDWAKKMNAQVVRKFPLNLRAGWGPRDWCLIQLN